jgi:hypothetical protein
VAAPVLVDLGGKKALGENMIPEKEQRPQQKPAIAKS